MVKLKCASRTEFIVKGRDKGRDKMEGYDWFINTSVKTPFYGGKVYASHQLS